jgi:hypothetical protein
MDGRSEIPLSSSKTIQAWRRRAFFYSRPALGHPVPNRWLVAFLGTAGGPLQGPIHPAENPPNMTGVIGHVGLPLDDQSDAGQGPQISPEAVLASAPAQLLVQLLELRGRESRLAPGPTGGTQARDAGLFPLLIPATDALAADLQGACDEGLDLAQPEEAGGLFAPRLERSEISPRTEEWLHGSRTIPPGPGFVTVLCAIQ